jgi:hypothetical protein
MTDYKVCTHYSLTEDVLTPYKMGSVNHKTIVTCTYFHPHETSHRIFNRPFLLVLV